MTMEAAAEIVVSLLWQGGQAEMILFTPVCIGGRCLSSEKIRQNNTASRAASEVRP